MKEGRDPDFVGNNKFYVGNLDFGVEEDDLRALFADVGEVGSAPGARGGTAFLRRAEQ